MYVVSNNDWVSRDNHVPAAIVNLSIADISARQGFPVIAYDVDGLGKALGQMFRLPSGVTFVLEQLTDAPRPHDRRTKVECLLGASMEGDLIAALSALAITPNEIAWVQAGIDEQRVRQQLGVHAKVQRPPAPQS